MKQIVTPVLGLVIAWLMAACSSLAQTGPQPDFHEQVRNHVTCYPFGLDKIGAGNFEAGKEFWKGCYAPDFEFTAEIPGMTLVCPGEKCPFPKGLDSITMRAMFARGAYEKFHFIRTRHHLTNITVLSADDKRAEVKAYLQAWHLKDDQSSVIGSADYGVSLERREGQWLITRERMVIDFEGGLNALKH
jgi:hypothetical protein